jgi:copper transport protein
VHFFFSEEIDPRFSQLTLLDAAGKALADVEFTLAPGDLLQLRARLPALGEGAYVIAWRVLSAVDGHITKGVYPLHVGQSGANCFDAPLPGQIEDVPVPWGRVFISWVNFISIIALAGAFFFQARVIEPSLRAAAFPKELWASVTTRRLTLLLYVSWGLFVLTALAQLAAQAMSIGEASLDQAIQSGLLSQILWQTRFGQIWLVRMGLALLAGILLFTRWREGPAGLWALLVLSFFILLAISLSSHSAALTEDRYVAIFVDWLHLSAAALWIGGLLQLIGVAVPALRLIPGARRVRLIAQIAPRFSNWALASVILLILTGVYSAWRQVASLEVLFLTTYGRALAIKHVLLLFTIGVAAVHFLHIVPRIKQSAELIGQATIERVTELTKRFRRLIGAEVTIVAGVIFFAGVLTLVPPTSSPPEGAALARSGPVTFTGQSQGLTIVLRLCTDRIGENEYDVYVTDAQGAPVADALQVRLGFGYRGGDYGSLHALMASAGEGHYRVQGAFMNFAGDWEISVSVRRAGQAEDARVSFSLTVKA